MQTNYTKKVAKLRRQHTTLDRRSYLRSFNFLVSDK
jgi:hypothetical protein